MKGRKRAADVDEGKLLAEAVEWARPFIRNNVAKSHSQSPQEHAASLLPQDGDRDSALQFELTIAAMVAHAERDPFCFDVCKAVAAACLRDGRPLLPVLDTFAADVLGGKRRRPTRRGPQPRRAGSLDRIAFGFLVRLVAKRFGLAEYSNNDPKALTAARVVERALACEGRALSHDAVVKARQDLGELIR